MLEDRPITQRVLCGSGAFALVFTAAMAGSAVMITGGLGFGGDDRREASTVPQVEEYRYLTVVRRPNEAPVFELRQTSYTPEAAPDAWEGPEFAALPADLEGSPASGPIEYYPSEDEIRQQIEDDWDAMAEIGPLPQEIYAEEKPKGEVEADAEF